MNGTYTPASSIEHQQGMARMLMGGAMQQQGHPLANLLLGLGGGFMGGRASRAEAGNQQYRQDFLKNLPSDPNALSQYLLGAQDPNLQDAGVSLLGKQPSALDQALTQSQINKNNAAATKSANPPRTAADTRALYAAEDEIPQLQGTLDALDRAAAINDKTFSGVGASTRGYLGSKLPDYAVPDFFADPETAKTTSEWELIMSPAALEQMSNTLKGATTDFELRKYIGLLADPSTDPSVRKGIIARMKSLAEQQMKVKQGRIGELRGAEGAASEGEANEGDTVEGPDGQLYVIQGGQLVPAQ